MPRGKKGDVSRQRRQGSSLPLTQGMALEIFIYRLQRKTCEEIAALLGVSTAAVAVALNRKTAVSQAAFRQLTPQRRKMFETEHFCLVKRRRSALSPQQAAQIWRLTRRLSPTEVAVRLEVDKAVAYNVATGRAWRWLTSRLPGNETRPPWMRRPRKKEVMSGD